MKSFREEFVGSLDAAYESLTKCDFLEAVRSKEEAIADVKIIGRGWTEKKVREGDKIWISRYLLVESGSVLRFGHRVQLKIYRREAYKNEKLVYVYYNATNCSGCFDSVQKLTSGCVLRHHNNFRDLSEIDIII